MDLCTDTGESVGQPGTGGGSWVPSRLAEKGWSFGVAILSLCKGETPPLAPVAWQGCTVLPPSLGEGMPDKGENLLFYRAAFLC